MSLKHGLLGLLNYKPMTGYELMKIFNESLSFFWTAQTSQIYRELDSIEKKGWVSSEAIIQTGKPNKKIFTLKEDGKLEFVRWLNEHTIDTVSKTRDEMTLRVFFASEGDLEALKCELLEYKKNNEIFVSKIEEVKSTLELRAKYIEKNEEELYWKMAINRGQKISKANIEWVDECIEMLDCSNLK